MVPVSVVAVRVMLVAPALVEPELLSEPVATNVATGGQGAMFVAGIGFEGEMS
jgi:hypothetical protein